MEEGGPLPLPLEEGWDVSALGLGLGPGELWRDLESEVSALQLPHADLDSLLDWSVAALEGDARDPLVHHDCMWAGQCDDRLHPGNERSLLRDPRHAAPAPPHPHPPPRPDTPLSLDEEEPPRFRHSVDLAGTARRLLQPPADRAAVAADHSYTQRRLDPAALGVQTPSDSEEEIDVETVGEKTSGAALPTNPSVSERASLQRTVASAMLPGSGSGPASGRKRGAPPAHLERARKRARAHRRAAARARSESDDGGDGDVERRSLHNDMERMRRIGLKNLFDALKAQVPSTRDKARAPKVAILREAALLCRRLQAEDRERAALQRHQDRLLARVRRLRDALRRAHR